MIVSTGNNSEGTLHFETIEPTIFFVRGTNGLQQGVDLTLVNAGLPLPIGQARLIVRHGSTETRIALGAIEAGQQTARVYMPDVREAVPVEFVLLRGEQAQDRQVVHWEPERHWEVFLTHTSHHDLGYTDLPSNLLREHDSFLDDALRFCDETSDFPEESRFRFVVEQAWSLLHYLENRPPDVAERMVRYLREGRIEVTALLGNETSELCGSEEQVRLAYPSFRLKRRFGIPIETAELNDVPGLSWGLVSVLAGAGIRYFAPQIPDYYNWGYTVHPFWDEKVIPRHMPGAFWWEGPDGSRVLLWYGLRAYLWTYDQSVETLAQQLRQAAQGGYPYEVVNLPVRGGARDNSPTDGRFSYIAREWNARWAYPRLIVGTNIQFFRRFEKVAGSRLPVFRGELPNTDYTVGATSTMAATAVNRLTHDVLAGAEKLATCATLVSDYDYPADTLAEAYDHMLLYDEHTWGMAHPIGPAQEGNVSQKSQFAYRAAALAHDVLSKSTNRLADQLHLPEEGYHVVVFNPATQARTDVAHVPAVEARPCGHPMYWRYPPEGRDGPPAFVLGTAIGRDLVDLPAALLEQPFALIDLATGESIPYQVVTIGDPLAAKEGAAYRYALGVASKLQHKDLLLDPALRKALVFAARDVPSLGYKTFRIVPTDNPPTIESSLRVGEQSIENRFYRVTLDPRSGAITSIYDKELRREWVDENAEFGFNQLVVRSAQTGQSVVPTDSAILPGEQGPVFASLVARGDGLGCPQRTQEIILYEDLKRIDLHTRLLKDATPLLEVYLAFPFAVERPSFHYQASNAVMEPIRDQLPGSNTDSYAIQHWVHVGDADGGVTWSSREAAVVALGQLWPVSLSQAHHGITPPGYGHPFLRDPADFGPGHIYSYALMNNFRTNFQPVQVADVLFRYSLTTGQGDWRTAKAGEFGEAVASPLIPVITRGGQAGNLASTTSFCAVDRPNVRLLTVKAAEDGDGVIVRLAETEGQDTLVTVRLPYHDITQALQTNLVEEDEAVLTYDRHTVRVPIQANGIATVRCRGARRWPTVSFLARH